MLKFGFILLFIFAAFANAEFRGPFIVWGSEKVLDLQNNPLVQSPKPTFIELFRAVPAVIVFIHNNTYPLESRKYPKFRTLIQNSPWTYLPQRRLKANPINYNSHVEVFRLQGDPGKDDEQVVRCYRNALAIYGEESIGIFASGEDPDDDRKKREAKNDAESATTTSQTPIEETDKSFIYIADGKKAALVVSKAPILTLGSNESIVLEEHNRAITFDDQKAKGYGRLNIIYTVDREKLFVRFNFTLNRGSWAIKSCEVEFKGYKTILPILGSQYTIPSAPLGFSYRCGTQNMIFANGTDTLNITNYQVQPWLNGSATFGPSYDCVGFITSPILAGLLVTMFLCIILTIGIVALLEVNAPNRFESSRSKQLTFTVQE